MPVDHRRAVGPFFDINSHFYLSPILAAGSVHFAWTRWLGQALQWTLVAGSGFWPDLWFPEQSLRPQYRLSQPTGWPRCWSDC